LACAAQISTVLSHSFVICGVTGLITVFRRLLNRGTAALAVTSMQIFATLPPAGVARCFISMPTIRIWVYFSGPWNGKS
jgi:hypothetical protein